MKHILIIGATGQIGSELTMELRRRYGNTNVVAGYIQGAEPKGELKESGPSAVVDVTNGEMIESVVKEYHIDTIYNLAALLSVVAESKPKLAWKIGIDGLLNVTIADPLFDKTKYNQKFLLSKKNIVPETHRHHQKIHYNNYHQYNDDLYHTFLSLI